MGRSQSRRTRLIFVGVLVAWIAHDLFVPPRYAFDARVTLAAIDQYRSHVSPRLHGVVECRFTPTCSWYGHESIRKHGLLIGGFKTFWRIARCGPWTKLGTSDPP
jgi:putative membrane protein insertion efficiency factor